MERLHRIYAAILALIIAANLYACGAEDNINNTEANNITATESSDMNSTEEGITTDIESSNISAEEMFKLKVGDIDVKGPGEHILYMRDYSIANINHADIKVPRGYEYLDAIPCVYGGDTIAVIICVSNTSPVIVTAVKVGDHYSSEICYADPGIPISEEDYQSIIAGCYTPAEMKEIYTIGDTQTVYIDPTGTQYTK